MESIDTLSFLYNKIVERRDRGVLYGETDDWGEKEIVAVPFLFYVWILAFDGTIGFH